MRYGTCKLSTAYFVHRDADFPFDATSCAPAFPTLTSHVLRKSMKNVRKEWLQELYQSLPKWPLAWVQALAAPSLDQMLAATMRWAHAPTVPSKIVQSVILSRQAHPRTFAFYTADIIIVLRTRMPASPLAHAQSRLQIATRKARMAPGFCRAASLSGGWYGSR